MTAEQLIERARRHDADAHAAYDRADAALNAHHDAEARDLYAQGEWCEAAADLCRAEAAEIGALL